MTKMSQTSMFKNERFFFNSGGRSTDSVFGELRKELQWSGMCAEVKVAATVVQGDILMPVRQDTLTRNTWIKADSDVIATMPGMAYVLVGAASGDMAFVMIDGYIRDDAQALGAYAAVISTQTDDGADNEYFNIGSDIYQNDVDAAGVVAGRIPVVLVTGSLTKEDVSAAMTLAINTNGTELVTAVDNEDGTITITADNMGNAYNAVTSVDTNASKVSFAAGTLLLGNAGGLIHLGPTSKIQLALPSGGSKIGQVLGYALNDRELMFRPIYHFTTG
jgi:hypothetical protein